MPSNHSLTKIRTIFGYHSISSALEVNAAGVKAIYLQKKLADRRILELLKVAKLHHIPIKYLNTEEELKIFTPWGNHQGVAAEIIYPGDYSEDYLDLVLKKNRNQTFLLILDGVQDPHNLGACLRTANAAGADAVIIPKDRACGLTPTVYKVASGAVGVTPLIQATNLVRTIRMLKEHNFWIYGAAHDGVTSLYQVDFKLPLALVFGAEDKGLRRLTRENCDLIFKIPMQGSVANLNVSVAVGVGLFQAARSIL